MRVVSGIKEVRDNLKQLVQEAIDSDDVIFFPVKGSSGVVIMPIDRWNELKRARDQAVVMSDLAQSERELAVGLATEAEPLE